MKNIQARHLGYVHNFACKRCFVWGIIEQGVFENADFVIKHILGKKVEAGGLIVTNKMHFVPFGCEGFTKFGCHYTASTKCGITYNTYFHQNQFEKLQQSR